MVNQNNMNEKYKKETDYRKIPRELLNPNIPNGRGIVKWAAFKTIPEQYDSLEQYMRNQNKVDMPELFNEEKLSISNTIQLKLYLNEITTIKYWKNGYYYNHQAFIQKFDTINQKIVLSNKQGNQTLEIPLKNISNIE